ncbi:carbohydrate ABC transporter permease [Rhodophyticola sp. CCM32]|uniref:carbohydrate ABC transporter permease n=1 Tax=Rhodophyticola sp. CCM32 TaxID=2916397 RepID=UPI00107F4690|nr:carbohydrate ABC transporter permease [Rhodophyticola sp. CCM32]QBY01224.1 carbohydrate ABC transporter permease [Rhodophyticola sp. CCM32]
MRKMRRLTPRKIFWNSVHYTVLTVASFLVITPLVLSFFTSLKTPIEALRGSKTDLPADWFNYANFVTYLDGRPVGLAFYNTLFVLVFSLLIAITIGTMAAYALDRFRFRGRGAILFTFILLMAVPGITTQVSTFQVMSFLGLVGSKWSLILLYSGADVVTLYIFMQFINGISREIDESARIEGAGYFTIFFKIILPLLTPAISTIVILRTIHIYNDFVLPYLYTPRVEQSTVSMLLYRSQDMMSAASEGALMAGIMMVIVPSIVVFLLLQRQIVSGVMRGAVKG